MGLEMLRGSPTKVQNESTHEDDSEDRILIPLAMPLIAGPGAIATVITFSAKAGSWEGTLSIAGAILITGLAIYVTLKSAAWVQKRISARGQRIFLRFMGLILVAVGTFFLMVMLGNFNGSVLGACGRSADQKRDREALSLHFFGDMYHFVQ